MAKEPRVSFVHRLIEQTTGKGRSVGAEDDPARQKYPLLWEWLTTIYVGKDRVKAPATMSIALVPEGVLIRVNDRDLSTAVEVLSPTLDQCFELVEANLASPRPGLKLFGKKEPHIRQRKIQG